MLNHCEYEGPKLKDGINLFPEDVEYFDAHLGKCTKCGYLSKHQMIGICPACDGPIEPIIMLRHYIEGD